MANEPNACPCTPIAPWKRWAIRVVVWGVLLTPLFLWPKVIGVTLGTLILTLAVLWFGIKWKVKKILQGLESADGGLLNLPETMPLAPAPDAKWKHVRKVLSNQQALAQLGFSPLGTFSADDYAGGLRIAATISVDRSALGLVYDEAHGSYVEFLARTEDDEYLAFTNGGYANTECIAYSRAMQQHTEMEPADLFGAFKAFAEHRPRVPLDPETFVFDYACFYEFKREWFMGEPEEAWDDDLREAFLDQCGWRAVDWEKKRNRVFFIHDRMSSEEVAEQYLELLADPSMNYREKNMRAQAILEGKAPRAGFRALLGEDRAEGRVEAIMAVKGRLPADAYLGPAPMAWD